MESKVTSLYSGFLSIQFMWLFTIPSSPNVGQHSPKLLGWGRKKILMPRAPSVPCSQWPVQNLPLAQTHFGRRRVPPTAPILVSSSTRERVWKTGHLVSWSPLLSRMAMAMGLVNKMLALVTQRFVTFSSLTWAIGGLHRTAGAAATLGSWEKEWSEMWPWNLWAVWWPHLLISGAE